jgi:hypothetical protein
MEGLHERVSSLETGCMARHYPSHLELHIPFRRRKKKKGRSAWIPRHMDAAHPFRNKFPGANLHTFPATLRWARAGNHCRKGFDPSIRPRSLVLIGISLTWRPPLRSLNFLHLKSRHGKASIPADERGRN